MRQDFILAIGFTDGDVKVYAHYNENIVNDTYEHIKESITKKEDIYSCVRLYKWSETKKDYICHKRFNY